MTGVLGRLKRAGWITRDRVESDRRAALVAARLERIREVASLYGGMNSRIDDICADYRDADLK
jgi:hypothetical protein